MLGVGEGESPKMQPPKKRIFFFLVKYILNNTWNIALGFFFELFECLLLLDYKDSLLIIT